MGRHLVTIKDKNKKKEGGRWDLARMGEREKIRRIMIAVDLEANQGWKNVSRKQKAGAIM